MTVYNNHAHVVGTPATLFAEEGCDSFTVVHPRASPLLLDVASEVKECGHSSAGFVQSL